jgi:DNA-binding beta-propeller fold protein YncE
MKAFKVSILLLAMILLASACSSAQVAPTSTPELMATHASLPTNTSAPSPTPKVTFEDRARQPVPTNAPTAVVPVEFVQSIMAGPDPFCLPSDLAFDLQENFYVVDACNYRIVKFDAEGNFLATWGNEGTAEGQFDFVDALGGFGGVAVDSQGNVYVADTFNHRIQKFTGDGQFLSQWGSQGMEDGHFQWPEGLVVDTQGNLYVSDPERHDIQKFDSSGTFLLKWGGKGQSDGQFYSQDHLAMDTQGNIYVADTFNDRIQKFDSEGNFLFKWGSRGKGDGQFTDPYGVGVDSLGNIYVAEYKGHRIQVFDGEGRFLLKWGTYGNGDLEFNEPVSVAARPDGRIYVVDYQNNRIQVFRILEN